MVDGLFHEFSSLGLLFDQLTIGGEFHFHFDLLKTAVITYQSLADDVIAFVIFIFKAKVVAQVDATLDDLTTAIAFYVEGVVSFFRFGRTATAKEVFEEAHSYHPVIARERKRPK